MSEIFVYDSNTVKLSETEIKNHINAIAQLAPHTTKNTGKGFIFKFYREADCNFIFSHYVIKRLADINLKASLGIQTQKQRKVYIPDPPGQYLNYTEQQFIADIWKRYGVHVLSFKKFTSSKTGRNYFIFTPVNSTATKSLIHAGKIILFNYEFPVQAKRGTETVNNPTQHSASQQQSQHGV